MGRRGKRHNRTGRSDGGEQFLAIPYAMALSPAWCSLSSPAVKVFIALACRYNGGNNGRLSLSLDEGARLLALGKATVHRALNELQAKGFLLMTRKGHWYGRKATEFALTTKSLNGMPATNDWRRWRPDATKTERGTVAEHIRTTTGTPQNREL